MEDFWHHPSGPGPSQYAQDTRSFPFHATSDNANPYSSTYSGNVSSISSHSKPHVHTFFPHSASSNISPYSSLSAPSPFSSGSSSSFPGDSPPAEPPLSDMEPDYPPAASDPVENNYHYATFDQKESSRWASNSLEAAVSTPGPDYSQSSMAAQPVGTPLPITATQVMSFVWESEPKKFHPHPYSRWAQDEQQTGQQGPQSYPSFSTQVGRMRSLSDGAPSGSGSTGAPDTIDHNYVFPQTLDEQNNALGFPSDAAGSLGNISPNRIAHQQRVALSPPHSHLRSISHEQEQVVHARRERERSMSDAAAYRLRPSLYASSDVPSGSNTYESFGARMQAASTVMATYSNSQGNATFQQQSAYQGPYPNPSSRPTTSIAMPMPMISSMYQPQRLYDYETSPAYSDSASHPSQHTHGPEELPPVARKRQIQLENGQGGCDPQYLNGYMSGGANGTSSSYDHIPAVKLEEGGGHADGEETYVSGQSAEKLEDTALEDLDRDGDYNEEDDDDDDELPVSHHKYSAPGQSDTARGLRPRLRATKTARYVPYDRRSSGSPPAHSSFIPSFQPMQSHTRMGSKSRQSHSIPTPVPIPNLTKKSRGRRVPTVDSLPPTPKSGKGNSKREGFEVDGKNARTYTCDAVGCGKCFARGEHLKRHVRSIHTYEKRKCCLIYVRFFHLIGPT